MMRRPKCECCAHGLLAPILAGIILGFATFLSYTGSFCRTDRGALIAGPIALVLALVPACVRFPMARGARICYFGASVLAAISAIANSMCLVSKVDRMRAKLSDDILYIMQVSFTNNYAMICWSIGAGVSFTLALTAVRLPQYEENETNPVLVEASDGTKENVTVTEVDTGEKV